MKAMVAARVVDDLFVLNSIEVRYSKLNVRSEQIVSGTFDWASADGRIPMEPSKGGVGDKKLSITPVIGTTLAHTLKRAGIRLRRSQLDVAPWLANLHSCEHHSATLAPQAIRTKL